MAVMGGLVFVNLGRPDVSGHVDVNRTQADDFAGAGPGEKLELDQGPYLTADMGLESVAGVTAAAGKALDGL